MAKLNVDRLCQSAEACIGWPYVSPGTNDERGIDCSGLFVKAYRDQGAKIYHGSNTIFREYCSETGKISAEGQLRPGMAVFKRKDWTDADKGNRWYGKEPGNLSHIGLVTSINPLRIVHASSAGSVRVDTKIGTWKYWGRLKDVDYDETGGSGTGGTGGGSGNQGDKTMNDNEMESRFGVVTVGAGKTVKLRSSASQKSSMYWDIPHGNRIEVTGEKDGWSHGTAYDNTGKIRTGWMMSQFIVFEDETGGGAGTGTGTDGGNTVSVVLKMPENVAASLLNQLASQIGKG